MKDVYSIIKRPILTEKGTRAKEANVIIFEVSKDANKGEIKQSVEKLFKVHVESVKTQVVRGKIKKFGRFEGKRPNWKKAMVKIGEGEKIDFFEGV